MLMRTPSIDVILGLDWMKKYTTEMECEEKVVVVNKFPDDFFSDKLPGMLLDRRH